MLSFSYGDDGILYCIISKHLPISRHLPWMKACEVGAKQESW